MTPIVTIWIAMGAIGILIDLVFLSIFWRDRRKLREDHMNGGDEILNLMYIGVGTIAILKHLTVIVVGVAANFAPNSSGGQGPSISPVAIVITVGLFFETGLTVLTPAWVLWRRGILRSYLRSRAGTHFLTKLLAQLDRGGRGV